MVSHAYYVHYSRPVEAEEIKLVLSCLDLTGGYLRPTTIPGAFVLVAPVSFSALKHAFETYYSGISEPFSLWLSKLSDKTAPAPYIFQRPGHEAPEIPAPIPLG